MTSIDKVVREFAGSQVALARRVRRLEAQIVRQDAIEYGEWTDYSATSTIVGWSSFTIKEIWYKRIDDIVYVMFRLTGVTNSTSATFSLPYPTSDSVNATQPQVVIRTRDDATDKTGLLAMAQGSNVVLLYTSIGAAAWANTGGGKNAYGEFFYRTEFSDTSVESPSLSPSASESPSASASVSPSVSRSLSPSASASPSASTSPSGSPSLSPSPSASPTRSPSRSASPSGSRSASPSLSPSSSRSPSISPSRSVSPSTSPSVSRSLSPSASGSPSGSPSLSPSASASASGSPSVSPSEGADFTYQTKAQKLSTTVANDTQTIDVGSAADRLLIVMFQFRKGAASPESVSACTYNGVGLTTANVRANNSAAGLATEIWYLYNPDSGSNTLAYTFSASLTAFCNVTVLVVNGADATPLDNVNPGTGNSASPSVSVTPSENNCLVVGCLVHENASGIAVGAGENEIYATDHGAWQSASSYVIQVAAGAQAVNYTTDGADEYAESVAAFKSTGGP